MSYELGVHTRGWAAKQRSRPYPNLSRFKPPRRGPACRELAHTSQLGDLGISFRRPRWLRKLRPLRVLRKIAVPLAVAGGALLIPGVAPLALKAAGGLWRGGRWIGRQAVRAVSTRRPRFTARAPVFAPRGAPPAAAVEFEPPMEPGVTSFATAAYQAPPPGGAGPAPAPEEAAALGPRAPGINPALVVGGLALLAVATVAMGARRKG